MALSGAGGGGRAIEAGAAFVRIFAQDGAFRRGLASVERRFRAFGSRLNRIGGGLLARGAILAAPLIAAAKVFADAGDELNKMSIRTGIAVESLSGLSFAAEQSGADLKTFENGVRRMQRAIFDLGRGSEAARAKSSIAELFGELGLDASDLEGLPSEEQFLKIADGLAKISDESRQAAVAQGIFGRSGTMLIPLMEGGRGAIEELVKEAERLGLIMSTEDAAAAAAMADAMNRVKKSIRSLTIHIGAALAPALTHFSDLLAGTLTPFIDFIERNRTAVVTVAALVPLMIAAGGAMTTAGIAMTGLASAVSLVGVAMSALLSPLGLVAAAVTAGITAWAIWTESGRAAVGEVSGLFGSIKDDAMTTWGGIMDAFAAGDLKLAFEIAVAGIRLVWLRLTNFISDKWRSTVDAVTGIQDRMAQGLVRLADEVTFGEFRDELTGVSANLLEDAENAKRIRDAERKEQRRKEFLELNEEKLRLLGLSHQAREDREKKEQENAALAAKRAKELEGQAAFDPDLELAMATAKAARDSIQAISAAETPDIRRALGIGSNVNEQNLKALLALGKDQKQILDVLRDRLPRQIAEHLRQYFGLA